MRNFFLVLLLINLLAFAYQRWIIEPDKQVAALHIEQDYPRLTVVQLQQSVPVAPEPEPNSVENEFKCIKIGPISRENDAKALQASLTSQGISAVASVAVGSVWVGHWVQVVGMPDRAAALQALSRLHAAGLSDAYIVAGEGDSGEADRISLGVYRSSASADNTVARAATLGLATRMDERYQEGEQYWLDVRLPQGRDLQAGELRSNSDQILRKERVPCPPDDS